MNTKADQEIDTSDDDTIVLDDQDTEQPAAQADDEQAQATEDEGDTDEVVVSIGEEAPPPEEPAHAPAWVRELRKTNRELQRQNRELQSKLQTTTITETKPVTLGPKPKLEDHDYDADQFETALANWFERKRQAEEANAKQEAEVMTQQKAWQAKLDGYGKAKAELRVKDFEDAEAVAQELFNVTQQGVMLQGADNPALVVYALGKNPKKAQELAAIKDPVKFAFAVAKLEKDLKVTNRRAAPPPERVVSGTGRISGAVDSTLERLREEAARTGNMTKVLQYKAQKRSAK
jgi:desulfoferrodoxin (superoxide reductase-like protein)